MSDTIVIRQGPLTLRVATVAFGVPLPLTTAGDMLFRNALGVDSRLPIGTAGQLLTVVGGLPAWVTGSSIDPFTPPDGSFTVNGGIDASGDVVAGDELIGDFVRVRTVGGDLVIRTQAGIEKVRLRNAGDVEFKGTLFVNQDGVSEGGIRLGPQDPAGTFGIYVRPLSSPGSGADLLIRAGDASGAAQTGGSLRLQAGPGASGASPGNLTLQDTFDGTVGSRGNVGIGLVSPGARLTISGGAAGRRTLYAFGGSAGHEVAVFQGATGQTANLTEWWNNIGTVLVSVGPTGEVRATNLLPTFNGSPQGQFVSSGVGRITIQTLLAGGGYDAVAVGAIPSNLQSRLSIDSDRMVFNSNADAAARGFDIASWVAWSAGKAAFRIWSNQHDVSTEVFRVNGDTGNVILASTGKIGVGVTPTTSDVHARKTGLVYLEAESTTTGTVNEGGLRLRRSEVGVSPLGGYAQVHFHTGGVGSSGDVWALGLRAGITDFVLFDGTTGLGALRVTQAPNNWAFGTVAPSARLHVQPNSQPATVKLMIDADTAQTADIVQIRSVIGTVLAAINKDGRATVVGLESAGQIFETTSGTRIGQGQTFIGTTTGQITFRTELGVAFATLGNATGSNLLQIDRLNPITAGGNFTFLDSTNTNTILTIDPTGTADARLQVRGLAGQTGNLQEWQSSAGSVLASIGPAGRGSFGDGVVIGSTNAEAITFSAVEAATLNFGPIAAGAQEELTITVTGAAVGDQVAVAPPAAIEANLAIMAYVSAADTVTVRALNNNLVASIDPASASYTVRVFR